MRGQAKGRDPLDPEGVLDSCQWTTTWRGSKGQKLTSPCGMVYDTRDNGHHVLHALMVIVRLVRLVVPLAAAAQAGRCTCGAIIPWRRMGWANPVCPDVAKHGKWVEDLKSDSHRTIQLEQNAERISGVTAPRGWSLR